MTTADFLGVSGRKPKESPCGRSEVFARCREERGQTMAEYGVVLALVTLAVIGAMTMLSSNISGAFTAVSGILP